MIIPFFLADSGGLPVTNNLLLWLDASDETMARTSSASNAPNVAVGSPVMYLRDKSGNGHHFKQPASSTTAAPTLQDAASSAATFGAAVFPGRSFYFDGTDDQLSSEVDFTNSINDTFSVFVVALTHGTQATTSYRDVFAFGNTTTTLSTNRALRIGNILATARRFRVFDTVAGVIILDVQDSNSTARKIIGNVNYRASGRTVYANTVSLYNNATYTASGFPAQAASPMLIGKSLTASLFAKTWVAEILIYNGSLTETERTAIYNYLSTKHGI